MISGQSPIFTKLAPVLNVRDLVAERAFYEKLGLRRRGRATVA